MSVKESKTKHPALWVPSVYFAMGLPFVAIATASTLMYKNMGIPDSQIALWTSLIMLPWTLKFLWSPFLEMFKTKKYFVVGTQILTGIIFGLVALSLPLPGIFRYSIALLAIIAFSGSTHDIATDGVYLNVLSLKEQSKYIGLQGAAYNIAKILTGIDVSKLEDPTQSKEWRQYRYQSVTDLVNRLVKVAHKNNKLISAAVFPYPELARTICRQSWDDWNLDAVFPMVYQNFYDEDMRWIKTSTQKGVHDLHNRIPLITGLYLPGIPKGEFPTAVKNAFKGGAKGVAIFNEGKISDEQLKTVQEIGSKYQSVKK